MCVTCNCVQVIDSMAPGSAKVLDQVLKLIDAYDLYGSVAYPKRHTQDDISDIYLLPAATRGVFVNIALQVSLCCPAVSRHRAVLCFPPSGCCELTNCYHLVHPAGYAVMHAVALRLCYV